MNNAKFIYRTTLMSSMALIGVFIYCVAFMGCDTAQNMTNEVMQPTTPATPPAEETTPPAEETTPSGEDPTEPGTVGRGGGTTTDDSTEDSDDSPAGGFDADPNVDP